MITSYNARLGLGITFIIINSIFLILTLLQIYRSCHLLSSFKDYRVKLGTRALNLLSSTLLVTFACIDTDFAIWTSTSSAPPAIPDGIFYLNISMKALIDITLCVTGSIIVLSLIKSYFVSELTGQDFPAHITNFWFGIAISFSLIVCACLMAAFAAAAWVCVVIYSAVRLLYLFIAALYLAYTYYWVFYMTTQKRIHLRNSLLLLVFALLCFGGSIYLFVNAGQGGHTLRNVVSASLWDEDEFGVNFVVFLLGWGGYWYVEAWYVKFVWTGSKEVESRAIQTRHSIASMSPGAASSPASTTATPPSRTDDV